MTFQQPFVSVVVPTYNRQAGVLRLLDALAGQTYPADCFEVVVVDDGSRDGTVAALQGRETSFRLTVLQQAVNGGPAVARNAGVARALADADVRRAVADVFAGGQSRPVVAHDAKALLRWLARSRAENFFHSGKRIRASSIGLSWTSASQTPVRSAIMASVGVG